ncbi:MAG: N-acetylmuramoyl-L-alanine amidase [Chloroflexaceae bacterium]|nr:N-acetylmuramoyl-L-alanine amidase [Chloroflexaceae bacterium]
MPNLNIDTSYRSPNYTPGRPGRIEGITIHTTEGVYPSDLRWLADPSSKVSAHYLISPAGAIYQLVEDGDTAWHAAHTWGNNATIGIEISHVAGQQYPPVQKEALTALCRQLIALYIISPDKIVAHRWLTPDRRSDPSDWPDDDFRTWITELYTPMVVRHRCLCRTGIVLVPTAHGCVPTPG